jgi:hypothetical protein
MRNLRASIAGLMGLVLIAALGMAALRNASETWAGVTYLVTRGVLGLAILCAIYARGARRAWWLGFCLFGWGYLALMATRIELRSPYLPTSTLLVALRPHLGYPADPSPMTGYAAMSLYLYLRIGQDLWAILSGLLGGVLGRTVFARSTDRSRPPEAEAPAPEPTSPRRWLRPAMIAWVGLVLITSTASIRSGWNAGFWAGLTFALTGALLGLACVGAIVGRGRRRSAWLGAALLGAGYLVVVFAHAPYLPLPTGQLLNALRVWIPAIAAGKAGANARILDALERPVSMTFPDPTPLRDVLRYVTLATATPSYPGIPIYLDPIGLQEADQTPESRVTVDITGLPLKTSLHACLEPLGLDYIVKDGFLRVTGVDAIDPAPDDPFERVAGLGWDRSEGAELSASLEDPYLIVGHCLLALLAAGFGAVAAPLVAEAQREPPGQRPEPPREYRPT